MRRVMRLAVVWRATVMRWVMGMVVVLIEINDTIVER
jgi:hypothetical protein